jgi:hypothetical protein
MKLKMKKWLGGAVAGAVTVVCVEPLLVPCIVLAVAFGCTGCAGVFVGGFVKHVD